MKKSSQINIISTDSILGGKPRIEGTRISIDTIGGYINSGYGVEDIKKDYPHLSNRQIKSALDYIDDRVRRERGKLEPTPA